MDSLSDIGHIYHPGLSIDLAGVHLTNPLVLASGIWGCAAETLVRIGRHGAGAVTTKSCSLQPRTGHPNPSVVPWEGGLINAVGLANPGAEQEAIEIADAREGLAALGVPLIASVFGGRPQEYARTAEIVARAHPELIELNISCPNVADEFGQAFAFDPLAASEVTAAVREVYAGPLLVKLSPSAPNIVRVAQAVVAAGADGLNIGNTLGPGMLIDIYARRPVLSNKVGGISGQAIRPIAVRCVWQVSQAVDVPIIGTGGVCTGEDALEMVMAGATAVGIGSVLQEGPIAVERILAEMTDLMRQENITTLEEIRGCAHE